MEGLPTEIYQDIVNFQSDVNRPIDMSIYRELREDAAWSFVLRFLTNYLLRSLFSINNLYNDEMIWII